MIIGTAGHIDHGKTALVKALTGVEGDRLKDEKARGITIDLGFAYMPSQDGRVHGFVDVPGHERFVRTMIAGAAGIDFALLAVAADDGVKPQTREHLQILNLLGVRHGVIVLTKMDLVDSERLAQVVSEVTALTSGTTLAGARVFAVSARTGEGIDALRNNLFDAAAVHEAHQADGRFRLAVDRVFTLAGIGVVVTGTVLSGTVRVGHEVTVSPSGLGARVRSIHAHNRPSESCKAGERCALNLSGPGVSKDAIARGDVVLDVALHAPTKRIDATFRLLVGEPAAIGQWFPVRLHHAAAEVGAHIALLDDKAIAPGDEAVVQLVLDRPLAAASLDRFVARDVSAQRTIGGGKFVDLHPPSRKRRTAERCAQRAALAKEDHNSALAALLQTPPFHVDLSVFARDRALSNEQIRRLASDLDLKVFSANDEQVALTLDRAEELRSELMAVLAAFHAENPDSQGFGREHLRRSIAPRLATASFAGLLREFAQEGEIALDGAFVRLASHKASFAAADEQVWHEIAAFIGGEARFRPPRVRDVAERTGHLERDVRRIFKIASRIGLVDEIAHDHFFLRATVAEMVALAVDIGRSSQSGFIAAADFRDGLGNGRKVAIQILEFFDRHGVTLRQGDLRRVNKHRLDLFCDPVLLSASVSGGGSSPVGRSDFKSEWGSEPVLGGFDSHSPPPVSAKGRR